MIHLSSFDFFLPPNPAPAPAHEPPIRLQGVEYSPSSRGKSNSVSSTSTSSSSSSPAIETAFFAPKKVKLPIATVSKDAPSVGSVVLPSSPDRARPDRLDAAVSPACDDTISPRGDENAGTPCWDDESLAEVFERAMSLSETTATRTKETISCACAEAMEVQVRATNANHIFFHLAV